MKVGIAGLDELGMPELRALAGDLEHLLERDLKANKKKDLLALVGDALAELPPEALNSIVETHKIKAVSQEEAYIAMEAGSQEGAETLSGVEIDASEIPREAKFSPIVEPFAPIVEPSTPSVSEIPYAIQIREYPTTSNYNYGDVVVNPPRELCETITHAALSEEGLRRMVASGRAGRIHKL